MSIELDRLLQDAKKHVEKMDFLAIDPEMDRLVDKLVRDAASASTKRPLTRKA